MFFFYLGEHIKNWRPRYFILLDNGALIGFKSKPEHGFDDPLNNFTVKGNLFKTIFLNVVFVKIIMIPLSPHPHCYPVSIIHQNIKFKFYY